MKTWRSPSGSNDADLHSKVGRAVARSRLTNRLWPRIAVLFSTILALGVFATAVRAQGDEPEVEVIEMSPELQEVVGAETASVVTTDDNNTQTVHLRSDLYALVSAAAPTPVKFPVECSGILAVNWVGGPKKETLIVYEQNPTKVLRCKMVGGTYTCTSS